MRTFNEGKQVAPSKTEQWTIDPTPARMTGAAFIFDSFTAPDPPAPFGGYLLWMSASIGRLPSQQAGLRK